jgi:pimeloyl-ACP methyl ester carboxylesterase
MVYVEPRANGDSEQPTDESTLTAKTMVGDLERLQVHLGLKKHPVLMGHSHGGAIALGYAERFPRRVDKLALLAPKLMDATPGHMKRWMEIP